MCVCVYKGPPPHLHLDSVRVQHGANTSSLSSHHPEKLMRAMCVCAVIVRTPTLHH
jgi:hypothetical protein